MRQVIIRQRVRRSKPSRLKGKEFPYDDSYRKKLKLDKTDFTLPDGSEALMTQVGKCYVILCSDNKGFPLVILVDGVAKWYIDYGRNQLVSAYRDYSKVIDGLTKKHSSFDVADYYLMYEWYKRESRERW